LQQLGLTRKLTFISRGQQRYAGGVVIGSERVCRILPSPLVESHRLLTCAIAFVKLACMPARQTITITLRIAPETYDLLMRVSGSRQMNATAESILITGCKKILKQSKDNSAVENNSA
jgi:hypothetical protein